MLSGVIMPIRLDALRCHALGMYLVSRVYADRRLPSSDWLIYTMPNDAACLFIFINVIVCRFFFIVVIITWPQKFDFVLVPEHDVTGILT